MCLGIPGQIVSVADGEEMMATVDVCGVRRRINIACVVDDDHPARDCVGDWVLVHVGFALGRIDETEARETLRLLEEMAEMQAELDAMRGTADEGAP